MIYLNKITTEDWIKKNQGLSIRTAVCSACSRTLETTIPFMTKDYIGLTTPVCSCGSTQTKAEVAIPRSKAEKASWASIVDYR